MWNIMKAQNYQIRRDNITVYVFLFGLLISLIMPVMDGSFDVLEFTGSDYIVALGDSSCVVFPVALLVLICRICGWDYGDKTINYEVMSGHSRRQVYWGRVVCSIIAALSCCLIMMVVPVILYTIIGGWGSSLDFGNAMLSVVLAFFPFLRLISFFALITFLMKNCYAAMLVGWMLYAVQMLGVTFFFEMFDLDSNVQFASTNLMKLFDYSNSTLKTVAGKEVLVYDSSLGSQLIMMTVIVSLVISVIYLMVGYKVFKSRDLS